MSRVTRLPVCRDSVTSLAAWGHWGPPRDRTCMQPGIAGRVTAAPPFRDPTARFQAARGFPSRAPEGRPVPEHMKFPLFRLAANPMPHGNAEDGTRCQGGTSGRARSRLPVRFRARWQVRVPRVRRIPQTPERWGRENRRERTGMGCVAHDSWAGLRGSPSSLDFPLRCQKAQLLGHLQFVAFESTSHCGGIDPWSVSPCNPVGLLRGAHQAVSLSIGRRPGNPAGGPRGPGRMDQLC
jgi:hypothetical protein